MRFVSRHIGCLILRYREQARSHRGWCVAVDEGLSVDIPPIPPLLDQPLHFLAPQHHVEHVIHP